MNWSISPPSSSSPGERKVGIESWVVANLLDLVAHIREVSAVGEDELVPFTVIMLCRSERVRGGFDGARGEGATGRVICEMARLGTEHEVRLDGAASSHLHVDDPEGVILREQLNNEFTH